MRNRFAGTTPLIDNNSMKEISQYEILNLGGGAICFRGAINIDQDIVLPWIDANAKKAHDGRWRWFEDVEGNPYALNEDGNKFTKEQIDEVPVRVLQAVDENTEEHMEEIFRGWEDAIYKCLIRYTYQFPMILGTIWWRNRGHILRYDKGDMLGIHNDNDSNYRATNGERFIPIGQAQMRQTAAVMLYLNDCVESPELVTPGTYSGGQLFFPYTGVEHSAKTGDILIFPTNYYATHGVKKVTAGERYGYLEFLSHGSSQPEHLVKIQEPDTCDGWCVPHWLDNYYDDFHRYTSWHEENIGFDDVTFNSNPVHQNRSLEGENGLPRAYSHIGYGGIV